MTLVSGGYLDVHTQVELPFFIGSEKSDGLNLISITAFDVVNGISCQNRFLLWKSCW